MTTSLSMVVEAAHVDNANRIFRALTDPFGNSLDESPDPGATFSIPLSPSGAPNATHYGTLATGTVAQAVHDILLNGLPQDIDWTMWNLTAQKANQAWNTISFKAADTWDFQQEWSGFLSQRGVKKIEE
jgi:hypothetical protein